MSNSVAIIIDNGTGFTKAGFTSAEAPTVVIPTISEKEKATSHETGESKKLALSGVSYERPIKRSLINDWDEVEKFWLNVIKDKLGKAPEDHPLFLTEPAFNTKEHREKMAQIAFEKFNSPSLFLGVQSVLAIYAYGKMFGTVLEVGHGTARAVPVIEGFAQPKTTKTMNVAGEDLDSHLYDLIRKSSPDFNCRDIVHDIKEKHCYVSLKPDDEVTKTTYSLPDGSELTLGDEQAHCAELLFDPSRGELEGDGVHKLIHQAIEAQGQTDMYQNIVISGGSTMFKGMKERLEKELCDVTENKHTVVIKEREGRGNLAFIGGSILTALPTFKDLWLTKKEYEENGPDMVHTKLK